MNKSKRLVLIISVIVFIVLGTTGCGQKNQNEDVINKCEILDGIDEKNELAVDNVNEKISNSEISKENRLFEGKYVCDNKELEPSNGEGVVNVILEKDNQFIIELLFDGYYSGTYKVEEDILTCNANKEKLYEGGEIERDTNEVFTFKIIDNDKMEFISSQNNPEDFILTKGMTYSIENK